MSTAWQAVSLKPDWGILSQESGGLLRLQTTTKLFKLQKVLKILLHVRRKSSETVGEEDLQRFQRLSKHFPLFKFN